MLLAEGLSGSRHRLRPTCPLCAVGLGQEYAVSDPGRVHSAPVFPPDPHRLGFPVLRASTPPHSDMAGHLSPDPCDGRTPLSQAFTLSAWSGRQLGVSASGCTRRGGAQTAPSLPAWLHAARGQLGVTGLNGNRSAY